MCKKAADAYILALELFADWFVTPKHLDYLLFFIRLNTEYDYRDSVDDPDGYSNDDSDYIKKLKLVSWFNKYNQCKE